jgi:bifunctional non-homologous end joining protein LigD
MTNLIWTTFFQNYSIKNMGLEKYRQKRNFQRTSEPPPETATNQGPLTFVIQKHHARALHYDLRLELDGVLKSWAIPKGPSVNPEDKRMAVMVEDHPPGYASFEGAIPAGEYGAGEVIVWDGGTYSPIEGGKLLFDDKPAAEEQMRFGLEKGKLSFTLRGNKLKGSWTLVKIQKSQKNWLLIKHRDEHAKTDTDILKEDRSVLSNRTIEDVKEKRNPDPPVTVKPDLKTVKGARLSPFPNTVAPMLASLGQGAFSRPDWIYEPKLDGYRTLALIRDGKAAMLSRNGNNVTQQYNVLIPELNHQRASELVFDGEIIALDEKGKQCFQCLQNYLKSVGRPEGNQKSQYPLVYYVFDILYLDGYDLRSVPLCTRKELLKNVFNPGNQVRLVDYFEKEGETVYKAAVKNGLEGVIAKQMDSLYESGKRSPDWLKIKATQSDEFIIGGYSTAAAGRKKTFSSLLLGQYDAKGKLEFAGHVGSGFDEESLNLLKARLDTLKTGKNPFSAEPPLKAPTTWVKPELLAEVKFSERTQDGRLRAPVFIRLRDDKSPDEIRVTNSIPLSNPPEPANKDNQDTIIGQLQNPENDFLIEIEGAKIKLSNVDKVLWPAAKDHPGYTKRDLLVYLTKVSSYLLPHMKGRPLTLSRYPDGINGEHFYQKHWGHPVPEFVRKINIKDSKNDKAEYLICDNLASLLWLGQMGDIEFHTWFSRIDAQPDLAEGKTIDDLLDYPDFVIFDLDPYIYSGQEPPGAEPEFNHAAFDKAGEVAMELKQILDELKLNAFIKTSGKTGLHIHVPILRRFDYKTVRAAAEIVGKYLVQRHPLEITTEWAQEKRRGKIFIDYGQNVRGKTLACIYSPRPSPGATVSTPLRWEELGKVYPTYFTLMTLPARLKKTGDIWAEILSAKKDLNMLAGAK